MDIVYVLIGFVCGFLCNEKVWRGRIGRRLRMVKADYEKQQGQRHEMKLRLREMTLAEVKEMCKNISQEIIDEKKELDNENNKV